MKLIITSIATTLVLGLGNIQAQSVKATYVDLTDEDRTKEYLITNGHESLYYAEAIASNMADPENKGPFGLPEDMNVTLGSKEKYLYKDASKNLLTSYMPGFKGHYFKIIDQVDIMKWEIVDETSEVAGYRVQKAFTHFRGRDYEAWFSIDLPFVNGPWKFGGLPGLILEVKESTGLLHYQVQSITLMDDELKIEVPQFKSVQTVSSNESYAKHYYDQMESIIEQEMAKLRAKGSNVKMTINRPQTEFLEIY
ncbi:GLPGLI family protein [Penaeicola halotolerans]|uniref:GLPGLI family protein n=1 Tax=Penaeicola halotolerans TaxID=2793196 RepID=UPI001CF7EE39|nr:GLPGLI family protein [Penaeicola halotolerans]